MRKLLTAVAVAAALATISPSQAASSMTVVIQTTTAIQGMDTGHCVSTTEGVLMNNEYDSCQKSTVARHARCLFRTDPAQAQDATTGKLGYVFKIDAVKAKIWDASASNISDQDNLRFNLRADGAQQNVGGTSMEVPDADIAFYIQLGDCAGTVTPQAPAVGEDPILPANSFLTNDVYAGPGDELSKRFPSSRYTDPVDGVTVRTTKNPLYAVVTVIGGLNTTVKFECPTCPAGTITRATS